MGFNPLDYTDCSQKKCVCASSITGELRTVFDCDTPCEPGEVFSDSCCACHSPCAAGESYFCSPATFDYPAGCYVDGFDFTADPFFSP